MDLMSFVMVIELLEKIDTIDKAVQIVVYMKGSKYFLSLKKLEKAQEKMYQPVFTGTVEDFYDSRFYKKKSKGGKLGMSSSL